LKVVKLSLKILPYWFDKLIAQEYGVPIINVGKIIVSGQADGALFDSEEHAKLVQVVAEVIRKL
jgi:hypothetical protein